MLAFWSLVSTCVRHAFYMSIVTTTGVSNPKGSSIQLSSPCRDGFVSEGTYHGTSRHICNKTNLGLQALFIGKRVGKAFIAVGLWVVEMVERADWLWRFVRGHGRVLRQTIHVELLG